MYKKMVSGILVGALIAISIPTLAETVDVVFNKIKITVNGNKVDADNVLINGKTYVPLRAISEILNKDVTWDEKTGTAGINDKNFSPNANIPGLSRNNPADILTPVEIAFTDGYQTGTMNPKQYKTKITVKEILRGDTANQMVQQANQFNDKPDSGFDYLLAKIEFELLESPDQYDLFIHRFQLVSEKGKEYKSRFVSSLQPGIDAKLYQGSKNEGYAAFMVETSDSKPLISFGKDYQGKGGSWFKTY